jgi:hypothetical protein
MILIETSQRRGRVLSPSELNQLELKEYGLCCPLTPMRSQLSLSRAAVPGGYLRRVSPGLQLHLAFRSDLNSSFIYSVPLMSPKSTMACWSLLNFVRLREVLMSIHT